MSILVSSNFLVRAGKPADDKIIAVDIAARDAIPSIERYAGMIVTVQTPTPISYILHEPLSNLDWFQYGGDVNMIGTANAVPFVDSADTHLLRTSANFTRSPTTGIVTNNVGYATGIAVNTERYISPTGSDTTGNGTALNPWQTVAKALNECPTVLPGKYIIFCDAGIYNSTNFDVQSIIGRSLTTPTTQTIIEILKNPSSVGSVTFGNTSTIIYHNTPGVTLKITGVIFKGDGTNIAILHTHGDLNLVNCDADNLLCLYRGEKSARLFLSGSTGHTITNTQTPYLLSNGASAFVGTNITFTSVGIGAIVHTLFVLNSALLYFDGANTYTLNGVPTAGHGYLVEARNSYVNFGNFNTYLINDSDGFFAADEASILTMNDGANVVTLFACLEFFRLSGYSYFRDSSSTNWSIDARPLNGALINNGAQFTSNCIVTVGVFLDLSLTEYTKYAADTTSTVYSFDNRYLSPIGFTTLGKLPKSFSGAELCPLGISSVVYAFKVPHDAYLVKFEASVRIPSGVGVTDSYDLYINGASMLTVNLANVTSNSITTQVTINAGDLISFAVTTGVTSAEDVTVQAILRAR